MVARKKDFDEKETAEPTVKKKGSRVVFFLLVLVGVLVAVAVALAAVLYFVGIPGVMPKLRAPAPPVYETVELGERVVNLADPGGQRYLRVRLVLEYKKNEKLTNELKEKNAQIMDAMLRTLRSKSVEDIRPLDREDKVKVEIMNTINSKLKNGKIERIYFTDFLIQ